MSYISGSDLGSIEFIINRLNQSFSFEFFVKDGWLAIILKLLAWAIGMVIVMFFTALMALIQTNMPYSEAGDEWCPRIKLPPSMHSHK